MQKISGSVMLRTDGGATTNFPAGLAQQIVGYVLIEQREFRSGHL
jgi:hypothetical protein